MTSLALVLASAAAFAGPAHAATPASQSARCPGTDACIATLLRAAKGGQDIEQLLTIAHMAAQANAAKAAPGAADARRLPEIQAVGTVDAMLAPMLRDALQLDGSTPDYWRLAALVHRQAARFDEAERLLRQALGAFPTHAALWVDLATVFGHKGKTDDAVAALVVADSWSGDPAALRRAYGQAAQDGALKDMAPLYREAAALLARQGAERARLDASLPAVSLQPDGKPVASVRADTCPPLQYPAAMARVGAAGKVTLAMYVDADGKLLRAKKLESSGHVELDNATLAAIAGCAFNPAVSKGKSVAAWGRFAYQWAQE